MSSHNIIKNSNLEISDLLLCITKFLSPNDNNNLFKVNKCINKSKNKCKITYYLEKEIRFSKLIKLDKFQNKYTNIFYDLYDFDSSLLHNIKRLTFGHNFYKPINNLPNSITHLSFFNSSTFNQLINNLPNSITHITFGKYFNQPVDNLPQSIKNLTFGWFFNKPINNLPNSITHLTFGRNFNQPIINLPNSITHLTFGCEFNQLIDNLPNSITHLTLGNFFTQPINNLPNSITYLSLNNRYGCKLTLPSNIIINYYITYY